MSASVANAVNVSTTYIWTVCAPIVASTGATFTSLTVTMIVSQSLSAPSLTHTSNVNDPGPCASVGVQVKAPVAETMLAPGGTVPARL